MTIVGRATRYFLSVQAVFQRSQEVTGGGYHLSLWDKSETYSVEGNNTELRHYLTRLARRSLCFSGCLD